MPTYAYQCEECETEFEEMVPLAQYKDPQECPECGHMTANKLITPIGFVLKGDGWTGKNIRVKNQMREKNKRLKSKERDYKGDGMVPTLAPNVGGERVDSWSDAAKLAKSKGKDTSGYDKLARKESKS